MLSNMCSLRHVIPMSLFMAWARSDTVMRCFISTSCFSCFSIFVALGLNVLPLPAGGLPWERGQSAQRNRERDSCFYISTTNGHNHASHSGDSNCFSFSYLLCCQIASRIAGERRCWGASRTECQMGPRGQGYLRARYGGRPPQ